jgi:hypothetical protein
LTDMSLDKHLLSLIENEVDQAKIDKYLGSLIVSAVKGIEQEKNSVRPESILWSTKLATEPSYCHTIYREIYYLIANYLYPHQGLGIDIAKTGLAKPTEESTELDSPMRVYAAWDKLAEILPSEEDLPTLLNPTKGYSGGWSGNELGFNVNYTKDIMRHLRTVVAMINEVMD